MPDSSLDLIVWGATGFTGRLVAEHLMRRYPPSASELRWGLGGRNPAKLDAIREDLGPEADALEVVVADGQDPASMEALVGRTRVVVSTVGPFSRYGSPLVAACAHSGTHYCDITGEVHWVRRMIDAHEEEARASGARLVHFCGFDSIPSDLGVWTLQEEARSRWGTPLPRITNGVRRLKGGASGGTVHSLLGALDEAKRDREARKALGHPYSLNPAEHRKGPDGSDQRSARWDEDLGRWTAPFVMASVNTRVVRRSNAMRGFDYGEDFRYREAMITGRGASGRWRAMRTTGLMGGFLLGASFAPTRALLDRFVLPSPGEGPSAKEREEGCFEMHLVGKHPEGTLRCKVTGDRDPGYGSTSKMLGEAAACLALDEEHLLVEGGSWTPASAFGGVLVDRLAEHAGVRFEIED